MALENNLVVDSDAELKAFLSSILSSEGIVVNINRTFIAYNNGTNRNRVFARCANRMAQKGTDEKFVVISIKVTLSWLPVLCPAILTRIRTVKIVRSTPYGLTKHLLQVAAKTLLRTALLLLQQLPLRLLLLLHRLTVNMGQMNSMRLKRTICPSNHQF